MKQVLNLMDEIFKIDDLSFKFENGRQLIWIEADSNGGFVKH